MPLPETFIWFPSSCLGTAFFEALLHEAGASVFKMPKQSLGTSKRRFIGALTCSVHVEYHSYKSPH
ncbi:MAG: hypothetical protein D3922_08820 [Candidatus Electrothrix sp. AR1]|nr:hypothetical protein [Candidatus Electrothrix sp. AR1]